MARDISVHNIVGVIVFLVVGLRLYPLVLSSVADAAASLTGLVKTMVELIPPIYDGVLILAPIYWVISIYRAAKRH